MTTMDRPDLIDQPFWIYSLLYTLLSLVHVCSCLMRLNESHETVSKHTSYSPRGYIPPATQTKRRDGHDMQPNLQDTTQLSTVYGTVVATRGGGGAALPAERVEEPESMRRLGQG